MRIGIDIDDVLFDWFARAHTACVIEGITNGASPTRWEMYLDYGCTMDRWLKVMAKATLDGSLYVGPPMEGAVAALEDLARAGHSLHIVTARGFFQHGDLIRRHTIEWLRDYNVPHDSLTFAKDKTLVRTDVFVDDSVKNYTDLTLAGTPTWLVDAPHNQGFVTDFRVPSVVEFANAVLLMEEVPC